MHAPAALILPKLIAIRQSMKQADALLDDLILELMREELPDSGTLAAAPIVANSYHAAPVERDRNPDSAHKGKKATQRAASPLPYPLVERDPKFIAYPIIGGSEFTPAPPGVFASAKARDYDHYLRRVYVAGCPGLHALSHELCLALFKIGCCGELRLDDRMGELSMEEYAAAHRIAGGWSKPDPKWRKWEPMYLEPVVGPTPGGPVSLERRSLVVRVPKFLHWKAFDHAFDALVQRGALWPWLGSPAGRKLCAIRKVDPYRGYRSTVSDHKPDYAKELVVMRLSHGSRDLDRLIEIVEYVIAKSLGLVA